MRVRRTLAALLAAPFLLSACSGDSSVADPPVSSQPTSSSPTTQLPPHETPEHFIRRWAAAEKRMENTGNTGPYLAMSQDCRACRQLADDIRHFYSAGGYAKWGGWQIQSISQEDPKGSNLVFDVKVDSLPTTYRESADSPIKHLQGGPATHQLTLRSTGRGWQLIQKAQLAG
jgi:hypothetical protein